MPDSIVRVIAMIVLLAAGSRLAAEVYDPVQHGAVPDGKTLCTAAIQKAIDAAAEAGGGTVRLGKGTYLSGTLFFLSGVTLELDEGATLLASTDLKDYPHKTPSFPTRMNAAVTQSLIYAEKVEKIAIRGKGQINGQGAKFPGPDSSLAMPDRPFLIRMTECRDVLIEGVTLRDSAAWMQNYIACDRLTIRGIRVRNHANWNNDTLDIDGCQHVRISGVEGSSDDDGLCFKGTSLRPTKDVVVENCRFFSYCNALKFGTDSEGGLQDVRIRNVELGQPPAGSPPPLPTRPALGISGMAWEVVDGGTLQNLTVENVKIRGTLSPIFLRLGDRGRHMQGTPRPAVGALRDVTISNVVGEGAGNMGCIIAGVPSHPIENLTLRNIKLSFAGGGKQEDRVRHFGEKARDYPQANIFAPRLPASGFFFWHVKGLTLENVQLSTLQSDARAAMVFEDIVEGQLDGQKIVAPGPGTDGSPPKNNPPER